MTSQKEDEQSVSKSSEDVAIHNFYKSNIIQPLKGFCTTVEEGCSISKAARKLFISPSAISKQIASLEDKLKVKLFNKKTENLINRVSLELTEEGREFYERAKDIIDGTDRLVFDFLEDKYERESKTLKIGANSAILVKILKYITLFKKNNKDINIEIKIYEQNEGLELLSNNKISVFISSLEENEEVMKNLKFTKLTKYIPYWVLYKGHPLENKKEITKNDVVNSDLIFNYRDITMITLKTLIDTYKIKSSININDSGLEGQKLLIKNELGIWLIFDIYLNLEDKKELVIKNAENMFPTGFGGCFTNKYANSITKQFVDFLVSKKEEIFI